MQLHPQLRRWMISVTHLREATTRTEDMNPPTTDSHQAVEVKPVVEGQCKNLLYTEDVGFLPMQHDPRDTLYRHPNHQTFDVTYKDVLH